MLEVIEAEGLLENAATVGAAIAAACSRMPGVVEVRGRGLMLGIALDRPAAPVRAGLLGTHRIFTGSSSDPGTLRLLPPLNIGSEEADLFINALHTELALEIDR